MRPGVIRPFQCRSSNHKDEDICVSKEQKAPHPLEKPFSYSECDKRFSKLEALKDHGKIHDNEASNTNKQKRNCSKCENRSQENETPFRCSQWDKKFSGYKVLAWNICRGISNETKFDQIKHLIGEEEANIIFLQETDDAKENLESVKIDRFKTVVGNEGSEGTAGLMAFVSDEIAFKMREDLSSADVSSLWIEIERKNH